mmetsp:Transcript_27369/g.47652  ORF Transcript_27369/g.47652 Transcript_27369/m.47652 type:complete len:279 (-) Transcript_27369:80-916(-)
MIAARLAIANLQNKKESFKDEDDVPYWFAVLQKDWAEAQASYVKEVTTIKKKEDVDVRQMSTSGFDLVGQMLKKRVVGTRLFSTYISMVIIVVGISTGIDLSIETEYQSQKVRWFIQCGGEAAFVIFAAECMLKLLSESTRPWEFFQGDDGFFNTFDFGVVVVSCVFFGSESSQAVVIVRLVRLLRLLSLVRGIPELRVIIIGLVQGIAAVKYIVLLLFLVIYLFAILGRVIFGDNDPHHFGSIPEAMLFLFQIATLSSWNTIAAIQFFGCDVYDGNM